MDKVITTVLLTISAVIAAAMVGSSAFQMLARGTSAMSVASSTMEGRIKTDVAVVHATADQSRNQLYVWVKNVGSVPVDAPDHADLFLKTPSGVYDHVAFGTGTGKWQYALEGGSEAWDPAATVKITVTLGSVPAGQYQVTLVTPNGISANAVLSV